jgi:hypothetical protein
MRPVDGPRLTDRLYLTLKEASDLSGLLPRELAGAGKKVSTLTRKVAAIAQVHRTAGFESPSDSRGVRELLSGSA